MTITLNRVEGQSSDLGIKSASTYDEAQSILSAWGRTAPTEGSGYAKVDVTVEWSEDHNWSYRFDLTSDGTEGDGKHFETNLRNRLNFFAGRRCPSHLTPAKYQQFIERMDRVAPGMRDQAATILDNYFKI